MRFQLVAIAVVLLPAARPPLTAQTPGTSPARKTFTSPDGAFSFEYPQSLVRCKQTDPNSDWTPDSCASVIPVCDDDAHSGGVMACIAYPPDKNKTNLEAATFSVSEINGDVTENKCLSGVPNRDFPVHSIKINGVEFKASEVDGVATGSSLDAYIYRSFHKNRCYELDIRMAVSNPALFDPGTIKPVDLNEVRKPLDKVLRSFRFLK